MPKRTFQPKKVKTLRKFGFRARQSTPAGRNILKRRRQKSRNVLTKSDEFRLKIKKPTHRIK